MIVSASLKKELFYRLKNGVYKITHSVSAILFPIHCMYQVRNQQVNIFLQKKIEPQKIECFGTVVTLVLYCRHNKSSDMIIT